MCHVGNAVVGHDSAEKLYHEVQDYQEGRLDRNYPEYVYHCSRVKHREKDQQRVNGSGRAQEHHICVGKVIHGVACDSGQCPCQQIVQQELPAPYSSFNCRSEYVEAEHVEHEMRDAAVREHVGHKLPVVMAVQHVRGNHCKCVCQSGEKEVCQTEDSKIDSYQYCCHICVSIAEAFVDDCIAHEHKILTCVLSVKHQFLHTVQLFHTHFTLNTAFSGPKQTWHAHCIRICNRATVFFNLLLV